MKTQRERSPPILPGLEGFLRRLCENRGEGFVFLNREFVEGDEKRREAFASNQALMKRLEAVAQEAGATSEKERRRALMPFLRDMGQIPEKRLRQEFMKVTSRIGCPEVTKVHSLRHLFSTRAQEQGMNPLLVQGLLGHSTLDMTRRYTHFGMEAKRQAVSKMLEEDVVLRGVVEGLGS